MSKNYENGIVSTTIGSDTDISTDIEITGDVYWVDSVNGSDGNAGTNRCDPKATLGSAITAATANNGDVIIVEPNHVETLTSAVVFNKTGVRIFGLGTGSTKPSLTVDAAINGIEITGAYCELNGFQFPAGTTAANISRVDIAANCVLVKNCDFDCGVNDLESITVQGAGDCSVINGCTFTITADGPDAGIEIEDSTAQGIKVDGCSFDGGTFNFDNAAIHSVVAHTEFLYRNNILANKASIVHTLAAKGQVVGTVAADGCRVEI